jgi:hypothetical protein
MKIQAGHVREAGCIQIYTYAFVRRLPKSLVFGDHRMPLRNGVHDPGFVSGAYGTNASNEALFMAGDHAEGLQVQLLTLCLFYKLRDGMPPRKAIDRRAAQATGFLHLGRVEKAYGNELRETVISSLSSVLSHQAHKSIEDLSLAGVMVKHPVAAQMLLAADPLLDMIVRPALLYYGERERQISVATVRASRASEMNAQARYLEGIPVVSVRRG